MPSSFLILAPDVPEGALVVTPTVAFAEDYPLAASFYGVGYNHARLNAASGDLEVTFDLGTGNSRTIDHLVIGGVKSLVASSVNTIKVAGSNNGSTWIDQLGTSSSFLTRTRNGPYLDDVVFTATYNDDIAGTLAAYRYFKLTIAKTSGTAQFAFRKLYFGQAIDMGKEPDTYDMEVLTERDSDTWKYPRGHTIMSKAFYPKHRITVEWDGVSDAKANEFFDKVIKDPYRSTIYLYTSDYDDPLYDNKLMHCRVVADSCDVSKDNQRVNWNTVKAVFEEV
jgi:hypothetical protein